MTNDDKNDYKYDDNDDDTLAPALPPLRPGGRSLAVARRCFLPGVAGGRAGPGSPSFHSGRWLVVHGHKVFAVAVLIYHCGGIGIKAAYYVIKDKRANTKPLKSKALRFHVCAKEKSRRGFLTSYPGTGYHVKNKDRGPGAKYAGGSLFPE